jgi:hypothetical protein
MSSSTSFQYDPSHATAAVPSFHRSKVETYGGFVFCNPEEACRKILEWFEKHPALSDEQAVHELQIPNFRERISDLRKRGYRIHGLRALIETTHCREFHSMVYMLHRDIPPYVDIPIFWHIDDGTWVEKVRPILGRYFDIPNYGLESMRRVDRWILTDLLLKTQRA